MSEFTIYTDGSCLDNPGPGGWAAIIIDNTTGEREEISGGKLHTTNNRMEVCAAISALRKLEPGDTAEVFTDSSYLRNTMERGWLENWKKNNWLTQSKRPVQNQDLWQELDELIAKRTVNFKWVRAHNGNSFNEWCDRLARSAALKSKELKISQEDLPLGSTESLFENVEGLPTAKIKIARKLQLKKYREELNLFVAEGLRLCETALNSAKIEFGFYTEEFLKTDRAVKLVEQLKKISSMYKLPQETFDRISDTQTPQGIMLIVRKNLSAPEEVVEKSLIIALDGVKDPGNVGTILRTVEAFDCGIILLDDAADIFNPKVVRSSMGGIFNLAAAQMTRKKFLSLIKKFDIELTAAALDSSAEIYFQHDFSKKSAIVFGSEAEGISAEVLGAAEKIFIPMTGNAESLNVATAAAIIISEAARQRF